MFAEKESALKGASEAEKKKAEGRSKIKNKWPCYE
jgi:hypothetical protein